MSIDSLNAPVPTLPRALADRAKNDGDKTWAIVPKDEELTLGWSHITYRDLYHAMDGMVRWLDQNFQLGEQQTVFSFMGFVCPVCC